MDECKARIRAQAFSLGFDGFAVTTADPPESGTAFLRALEEGRHADMAWLARNVEKRLDPQRILPGARSVVLLAVSYAWPQDLGQSLPSIPLATDPAPSHHAPVQGVVARYACHRDYHKVLKSGLKALAATLDEIGGAGSRSLGYVDTGPILERDLAQRGGLGFVGKHTGLISKQLGNWFFLAEILTTVALEPDAPAKNHCGTCTRCLNACPTGALPEPFKLDARRCISYWTIEHRGSIPVEMRAAIGARVFGCDDCLAVCPWNRFAREGALMKAVRREDIRVADLLNWLELDEAGFLAQFAGTPLYRTKRTGLRRNICIALGNLGDPRARPALDAAARDPDPVVAEAAEWALLKLGKHGA